MMILTFNSPSPQIDLTTSGRGIYTKIALLICARSMNNMCQDIRESYQEPIHTDTNDSSASTLPFTRSSFSSILENPIRKFSCFICTSVDDLHRIETQGRSEKVLVAFDYHLSRPNSLYFESSKHLHIILNGSSDIFAADVHYKVSSEPEYEAHRIIDCGQAIRQLNPGDMYREFFCDLLD